MVTVGRGVPASISRRRLSVRTMGAASGRGWGCAGLEPVLTHAQPRDSARSELREAPSPAGPHGGSTAPRSAGDLVRSRSPGDHAVGAAAPTVSGHRHCGATATSLLQALPRIGETPPLPCRPSPVSRYTTCEGQSPANISDSGGWMGRTLWTHWKVSYGQSQRLASWNTQTKLPRRPV